jgi:hypothetical protein
MSITDFSNKISGSSPRSSEGLYKTMTDKSESLFSPKKSSRPRILSIPSSIKSNKNDSIPFSSDSFSSDSFSPASSVSSILDSGKDFMSNATTINQNVSQSGSPFFRYLSIFIIIGFLFLNLFLYLTKPVNTSIIDMYDPLLIQLGIDVKERNPHKNEAIPTPSKKVNVNKNENKSAINKLEKTIDDKKIVNKIDGKNKNSQKQHEEKEQITKQKPFIPEPDVSASRIQANKPNSKQGYCYIGEDRGFRSCIEVGEGDVCMSGDIFPTKDICINPNLRE